MLKLEALSGHNIIATIGTVVAAFIALFRAFCPHPFVRLVVRARNNFCAKALDGDTVWGGATMRDAIVRSYHLEMNIHFNA